MLLSGNRTILSTRDAHAWKLATLNVIKSSRPNLLLEKVELIDACHFLTVETSRVALSVLINQCLHFLEAILPSLAKIILRRRYDTPPPLTTSTKGTTNSPPPYTTQTPPNPHTTDAPTEPVTHGAATVNYHTRSPPPPKAVLG